MKKKIFSIALAACLIVLSIAGATVAYFTDTDKATHEFTAGSVYIDLLYAGEDTADGEIEFESQKVYPGQEITVDAAIKNTGTEEAYVGAIINISKVKANLLAADIDAFFKDILDTDTAVKYEATTDGYKVYVLKTAKLASAATADIFESIVIPTAWNNAEMATFATAQLVIDAYATQTVGVGFDNDAASALATAFATEWAGYTGATALN